MTAEIVLMNKHAVALAADSATTYGAKRPKIFRSANKIFMLSKYHPVGVMIYESAAFMGVPWESVIKEYRAYLGAQAFDTLHDYTEDLLSYLRSNRAFSPAEVQATYFHDLISGYFEHLRDQHIVREWKAFLDAKGEITVAEYQQIAKHQIKEHRDQWRDQTLPDTAPVDFPSTLEAEYKSIIDDVKKEVFQDLLTSVTSRFLTQLAVHFAAKAPAGPYSSGLVIVGFGAKDIFPAYCHYRVTGVLADQLLVVSQDLSSVTHDNNGIIVAFAQREMVASFMNGVDPTYEAFLDEQMKEALLEMPNDIIDGLDALSPDEKEKKKVQYRKEAEASYEAYREQREQYQRYMHVHPVVEVVAVLPKDELAQMAESLVNLTVLKRRVSMQEETVAGPIDVAVISKGDGFVWIKRKHYFAAEMNPYYMAKYYWHETDKEATDGT